MFTHVFNHRPHTKLLAPHSYTVYSTVVWIFFLFPYIKFYSIREKYLEKKWCIWIWIHDYVNCLFQILACVFVIEMQKGFCWMIQLFSLVCTVKGYYDRKYHCHLQLGIYGRVKSLIVQRVISGEIACECRNAECTKIECTYVEHDDILWNHTEK